MAYKNLQAFIDDLDRAGELRRVSTSLSPNLEITEVTDRVCKKLGPALLFEDATGYDMSVLMNAFGSDKRMAMALGVESIEDVANEITELVHQRPPTSVGEKMKAGAQLLALSRYIPKTVSSGACQEVVKTDGATLEDLPVLTCWPDDGGRFITLPLVITHDPLTSARNVGIYRMQVHDARRTGMHWQLQKGGGLHYYRAEQEGRPLELAAVLGGDPALILAAATPLPEGFDEVAFSGILRGKPLPMVRSRTLGLRVPAHAEFILEGVVPPAERIDEGPFGDHLGHYSDSAPFPVFHVRAITRRRDPVYPAAVVGLPPQEDRAIGDAVQEITGPLIRLIHPEVRDLWAYFETGFHNLLVVSVESRYTKEPMKTALGLMGSGQLSLAKCVVLVEAGTDVRDFRAVLQEVRKNFRAAEDFLLLPGVPLDTLDFTSYKMHLGSKMVIDATRAGKPPPTPPPPAAAAFDPRALAPEALSWRLWDDTLLAVRVSGNGRAALERLVRAPELEGLKLLAVVSEDVDIEDRTALLWGIFTRFDPARDLFFPHMTLHGASPVYRGTLGIDATHKPGYPKRLEMTPEVVRRVDQRWGEYFP